MRLHTPLCLIRECVGDVYNAECQLILALPRIAARVHSPDLSRLISEHLEQTRTHAARLESLAGALNIPYGGKKCLGMQGLLKEGEEIMGYGGHPQLVDAAIIGACRKVEHYEQVSYQVLTDLLSRLGREDLRAEINATLEEERASDRKLNSFASAGNGDSNALLFSGAEAAT